MDKTGELTETVIAPFTPGASTIKSVPLAEIAEKYGKPQFKVLLNAWPLPDCPRHIPWELIAPHETQALVNHDQSLERLNARGGLSPAEIWHVMHDKRWSTYKRSDEEYYEYIRSLIG